MEEGSDMRKLPTEVEVKSYLFDRKNWGRWGDDDEVGALNLVTPERRLAALASVRAGSSMSLARPLSTASSSGNPEPAQHFMRYFHDGGESVHPRPEGEPGGWAVDYYGVSYHGFATTHLDALCHAWDQDGLYNGRDPKIHLSSNGADFGGVQHWAGNMVMRGVLLDIPAYRGTEFVTQDTPVHGWELEACAQQQGIEFRSGDAVCVYMGREKWQIAHPGVPYGGTPSFRPGMHASCLPFLRDNDFSVLGWDMLDAAPWDYNLAWTTHGVIWAYGMGLVDNMVLDVLAEACKKRNAYDFMLVVAPLVVEGGTGSPVNPIAIL